MNAGSRQAIAIRPSTEGDLPVLYALIAMPDIRQYYFGAAVSDDVILRMLHDSMERTRLGQGETLVITPAGEETGPIAYAELVQGWLSFCVHPRYQGLAYASLLADTLCRRSIAVRPAAALHTCVLRGNTPSVRILEKCGFRFMGLTWQRIAGHAASPMLHYSRSHADDHKQEIART